MEGVQKMFKSPYIEEGAWFQGCFHVHTENSPCGHYSVEKVCELYADTIINYDFIAITDHLLVTPIPEIKDSLLVFPGEEFKDKYKQILGVGISCIVDNPDELENHQEIIDKINLQKGISIICHPHIYTEDYWPLNQLLKLQRYSGIEIYNHNVKMNNAGRAVATDVWDQLLLAGKKVWGFAADDMHHVSRIGGGFLMVLAQEKSLVSILEAVKQGSFYASTGAYFKEISVNISTKNEQILSIILDPISALDSELSVIGDGGKLLFKIPGSSTISISLDSLETSRYFRIELKRADGAFAWSQPFFKK